jgi:FlgN protein
MQSIGLHLAEILSGMIVKQEALSLALDRQRHALVQGHIEQIEAANLECEGLCAELERFENERESLTARLDRMGRGLPATPRVNAWSTEAELKGLPVRLDEVLPHLPENVRAAIEDPRKRLKGMIPEVQRKLRINAALAQNGSKVVHATLGIITSIVGRQGPDRHQIYGAKGTTRFGRTQVRSLLNRSA